MVRRRPDEARPEAAEQFYPRPGKKNVSVRLGIVPISGGKTVWVEWDRKKYEYLASVRWDRARPADDPGAGPQAAGDRPSRVDPTTGKTTRPLDEKDPAFTNLRQDMPRWLPGRHSLSGSANTGKVRGLELRRADGSLADMVVPYDDGLISVCARTRSRRGRLCRVERPDGGACSGAGSFEL